MARGRQFSDEAPTATMQLLSSVFDLRGQETVYHVQSTQARIRFRSCCLESAQRRPPNLSRLRCPGAVVV